ncbi:UDP-glucose iridoid glucosyltransferase [Linum perenne]
MVPFPAQGHITPMLHLATILHSKGFPITIAHALINAPNPSNYHPDFKFVPLQPDGLSGDNNHDILFKLGLGGAIKALEANCPAPFKEVLGRMMDGPGGDDCNGPCLIYDGLMYFAEGVAKEMGVPSLVLRTSSATNMLTFHVFQVSFSVYNVQTDSTSSEPVPGIPQLRYKDLASYSTKWSAESVVKVMSTIRQTRSSSAIIWNTSTSLESSSLSIIHQNHTVPQIPIFPIGPFHKQIPQSPTQTLTDEETATIAFLDKQPPNSVLYISFGSIAVHARDEFDAMAWGIANSGQRFLWVVRPDAVLGSSPTDSLLPDGFSEATKERGKVVKWAPQKKVLSHEAVRGFWTHSGWNSTIEATAEGVPMMCRPWFADQPVNARTVTEVWGIGIEVEKDMGGKEGVEKLIRRLMVEEEGEGIRKKALELKEEIMESLGECGSGFEGLNQLVEFIGSC